uniref:hypothetical protein n=1 Tax=Nonomuraea pusilla TaxID=46177 RepID=UPI0006E1FAF7|nr:hypothetical protein [Nonomuraea pusilla]
MRSIAGIGLTATLLTTPPPTPADTHALSEATSPLPADRAGLHEPARFSPVEADVPVEGGRSLPVEAGVPVEGGRSLPVEADVPRGRAWRAAAVAPGPVGATLTPEPAPSATGGTKATNTSKTSKTTSSSSKSGKKQKVKPWWKRVTSLRVVPRRPQQNDVVRIFVHCPTQANHAIIGSTAFTLKGSRRLYREVGLGLSKRGLGRKGVVISYYALPGYHPVLLRCVKATMRKVSRIRRTRVVGRAAAPLVVRPFRLRRFF